MSKEKRLGRGLEALLGQIPSRGDAASPSHNSFVAPKPDPLSPPADFFEHSAVSEPTPPKGPACLPIADIGSNPHQPRQEFDPEQIASLAESLAAHGLLQPVVVRKVGSRYQLIAGERRLRAAQKAGWTDVPVNIIEADDRQTAELAIIENLQRKDLNPLEKAVSFQRYLEQYHCTQDELARRLNMDRSTIANLIRLLELPEGVQDAVRRGEITQGHARALLPLGDEREQLNFCARIQQEGLNVRQTEALVQQTIDATDAEVLAMIDRDGQSQKTDRPQNEHLAGLEQQFRAALGLKKVQITHNARGRGKLVIHFRNHEEFDRILDHICGPHPQTRAG
jgi:ParB family transcriptional regulator, chromosome partitioning protein